MTPPPALALIAFVNAALGDAPPAPAPEPPVQRLGESQPKCREWTDGCIVCRKSAQGDPACSTPGAACVPEKPACAERSP